MRRTLASLLLALPIAVSIGCQKPDIDFVKIRVGMTQADIIARIGAPTRTLATPKGEVFEYEAYDRYGALIINRRSQFVRFINGRVESFGNMEDLDATKSPASRIEPESKPGAGQAPPAAPRLIATDAAPKAAGPYSQAVAAGGFLFAAGQTPRDPSTGTLVTESFEGAVNRVLDNLEAVLKTEGLDWADVVKTTVYLTKPEDFTALNAVYSRRLGSSKPARTTVFVAGLPGGAPVEMDIVARLRK